MRARNIANLVIVIGLITGCSDKDALEDAAQWYHPWYVELDEELDPQLLDLEEEPDNPEFDEPLVDVSDPAEAAEIAEMADDSATAEARLVTIKVQRGETVQMYSAWSKVPVEELKALNQMTRRNNLRIGQPFQIMLAPIAYRAFTESRTEHFNQQEKGFFSRFEVVKLDRYTVKRGDNIWKISKGHDGVPVWVLEKFNSNLNLAKLKVGEELLIPVLNELASGDSTASKELFASAGAQKPGAKPNQPKAAKPQRAEGAEGITVTVARNETLGHYAKWAKVSLKQIGAANEGINMNVIRLGQKIRLPIPDAKLANFYRKRRRFNGTPPPANIAPVRKPKAVATAKKPVKPKADAVADKVADPRAAAKPKPVEKPSNAVDSIADLEAPTPKPKAKPRKAAAPTWLKHRVAAGETAWVIAIQRYQISLQALRSANPGKNLDRLRAGDVLTIPVQASQPGAGSSRRAP